MSAWGVRASRVVRVLGRVGRESPLDARRGVLFVRVLRVVFILGRGGRERAAAVVKMKDRRDDGSAAAVASAAHASVAPLTLPCVPDDDDVHRVRLVP